MATRLTNMTANISPRTMKFYRETRNWSAPCELGEMRYKFMLNLGRVFS